MLKPIIQHEHIGRRRGRHRRAPPGDTIAVRDNGRAPAERFREHICFVAFTPGVGAIAAHQHRRPKAARIQLLSRASARPVFFPFPRL